jgi:Na+/melibiose symporter-like transporter
VASHFGAPAPHASNHGPRLTFVEKSACWPRGIDIRTAADVPPDSLVWMGLIYGPIVAGFAVVSIWCFSKHRLDRHRHAEIMRELRQRRALAV